MNKNFYDTVYYNSDKNKEDGAKLSKVRTHTKPREILFLRTLLQPQPQDKLLDIGCGPGDYLESLTDTGADLWGIDISQNAIQHAKQKLSKPDQILCASADPLSFKNNQFDFVTAWGVIEHFPSPASILREITRVLKSAGTAVVMVPNAYYYKFVWDTLRKGTGPVRHQEIENLFAFQEWKRLIQDNGLTVTQTMRHNKFNKPLSTWFRNLWIPFYFSNHFIFFCKK